MKIDLEFAELHTALFLNGTNLGLKLDHKKWSGLGLVYDRAEKELLVTWKGKTAFIPTTNVASMTPATLHAVADERAPTVQDLMDGKLNPTDEPIPKRGPGRPPVIKATAQVSTPTGHVFAGPGKGQTGL